ncbi:MAG: flagellar basal body rod protein FlgB [Rhizobiaceae bacterium]|nr:flagellar basal body rod protein FlgB [Rhizobiaceae bacterium]
MQAVNLFDIAAQQAKWLAVRQSAVSSNIANANTPGFRASDIEPFESLVSGTAVKMAATHPGHVGAAASEASFSLKEIDPERELLPSQNTVELESELIKAGEVRRAFELNTGLVKAFHRMLLMASQG